MKQIHWCCWNWIFSPIVIQQYQRSLYKVRWGVPLNYYYYPYYHYHYYTILVYYLLLFVYKQLFTVHPALPYQLANLLIPALWDQSYSHYTTKAILAATVTYLVCSYGVIKWQSPSWNLFLPTLISAFFLFSCNTGFSLT